MRLDALVEEVGRERYERACEWAWRTGARTGRMDLLDTMYVSHFHDDFEPAVREQFWSFYRAMLDSEEEAPADPIAYSLWVDYFENSQTVEEAWRETTRRDVEPWERRIGRVLDHAGPVPWPLKEPLFRDLFADLRRHWHIFEALKGGHVDVLGQSDPAARDWIDRLRLPPDTPGLQALREELR